MGAKPDGGAVRTDFDENGGLRSPLHRIRIVNHLSSVNLTVAVFVREQHRSDRVSSLSYGI